MQPAVSVIVCSYNSRTRIDAALRSLRAQDLDEPYEVIVVDSGSDGAHEYVRRTYPEVRLVRSEARLWPAQARNRGVEAARGEFVAFLPDDGIARPDWLRRRLAKHREGFPAVGGAITNGTPRHPVGSAGYYLEYSALIPSARVLAEQAIPHCLSYERSLLTRLGSFPEGTDTGEDTVFNTRCLAAGVPIGFDPEVQLAHVNPTRLRSYLRHQYGHGRGLVQCAATYGLSTPAGHPRDRAAVALYRIFVRYPARRWWNAFDRIRRGGSGRVLGYLAVTPLVWAGLYATAVGAWLERRAAGGGGNRGGTS
jgi:glycosyltransferase involved in cell wall biosynthesis